MSQASGPDERVYEYAELPSQNEQFSSQKSGISRFFLSKSAVKFAMDNASKNSIINVP